MKDRHLISVDELRAAGALDVPAAWRKSLADEPVERNLFSGLLDEDDQPSQAQSPTSDDRERDNDESDVDEPADDEE